MANNSIGFACPQGSFAADFEQPRRGGVMAELVAQRSTMVALDAENKIQLAKVGFEL